nr:MAG TPA: hypothetical protein [Caudoviricetes sp.]
MHLNSFHSYGLPVRSCINNAPQLSASQLICT